MYVYKRGSSPKRSAWLRRTASVFTLTGMTGGGETPSPSGTLQGHRSQRICLLHIWDICAFLLNLLRIILYKIKTWTESSSFANRISWPTFLPAASSGIPKIHGKWSDSHTSIAGRLGSKLLCGQKAVKAIEYTRETDCFSPQWRWNRMDSTELWNQYLWIRKNVGKYKANTQKNKRLNLRPFSLTDKNHKH